MLVMCVHERFPNEARAHLATDSTLNQTQVAEMTGRSGRIVRTGENQYQYVKRLSTPTKQKQYGLSMPASSDDADRLNVVEKRKFMDGKKSVAIISDAASTGISLHAAESSKTAHKRRVHFTIEVSACSILFPLPTRRLNPVLLLNFCCCSCLGLLTKPFSSLEGLIDRDSAALPSITWSLRSWVESDASQQQCPSAWQKWGL